MNDKPFWTSLKLQVIAGLVVVLATGGATKLLGLWPTSWTADKIWAMVAYRWPVPNGLVALIIVAFALFIWWTLIRRSVSVKTRRTRLVSLAAFVLLFVVFDVWHVDKAPARHLRFPPGLPDYPLVIKSAIGPNAPSNINQLQWYQCYQPPPGFQLIVGHEDGPWDHDTTGRPRACGRGWHGNCGQNDKRCWNVYLTSGCIVRKDWFRYYEELVKYKLITFSVKKICDRNGWR